jgi:hypothetical protein
MPKGRYRVGRNSQGEFLVEDSLLAAGERGAESIMEKKFNTLAKQTQTKRKTYHHAEILIEIEPPQQLELWKARQLLLWAGGTGVPPNRYEFIITPDFGPSGR